jgi:hypothetical protein
MALLDVDLHFRQGIKNRFHADTVTTLGIGWSILSVQLRPIAFNNANVRVWLTTPTTVSAGNSEVIENVFYNSPPAGPDQPYSIVHQWTLIDGISFPLSPPVSFPPLDPTDKFCPGTNISVVKEGIASKIPVSIPIAIDADIIVAPNTTKVIGPAVLVVPIDVPFIYDFTVQGTAMYQYTVNNTTVTELSPIGWGTFFNLFPYPTVTIPDLAAHPERVIITCTGEYTAQLFRAAVAEQEDPTGLPMPSSFPLFPRIPSGINDRSDKIPKGTRRQS